MKKLILSAVAAAAFSVALPALAQNLAIVNGKPVPKSRADALTAQVAKSGRPMTPEVQNQIKDEVVAREIFMQEAQKRGLDASDDFKVQMELARQTLMIRELFSDYQKTNPVSEADIKAEYDKFAAANSGKEYRARHILVEKEDEAKAILASLKKGGKFDEIAKKQSKDPGSGANGGDLDWANAASYVPEFSGALIKLNKGQTTDAPVKSQFGWHIIRLIERGPKPLTSDELDKAKSDAYDKWLSDEKAKSTIKMDIPATATPFPTQAPLPTEPPAAATAPVTGTVPLTGTAGTAETPPAAGTTATTAPAADTSAATATAAPSSPGATATK